MNGIKHLYVVDTNGMNAIVIRDMDTDTAAVVNWDISDDEISEIAGKFDENQNDSSWYADDPKWEDWGTLRDSLNSFLMFGDYLERHC